MLHTRIRDFLLDLSLSPSAYRLDNWMTCCQRGLCECALAEGQSDPLACLSQRGKWRLWYAISSRNVQTVWTPRQVWLAVALLKVCRRNYLFGSWPEGLILKEPVVIYLFVHLNLMRAATFKNLQLFNTDFHRFWQRLPERESYNQYLFMVLFQRELGWSTSFEHLNASPAAESKAFIEAF